MRLSSLSNIMAIAAIASLGACSSYASYQEELVRMSGMDLYGQLCTSCHGSGWERQWSDGAVAQDRRSRPDWNCRAS